MKDMKLIMENWRKYSSPKRQEIQEVNWRGILKRTMQLLKRKKTKGKDFPSDGHSPAATTNYDIHQGGAQSSTTQDQGIDMSSYSNIGAPVKERPAIEYDPAPGEGAATSLANINQNIARKRKSDRELNLPGLLQSVVGSMIGEISTVDEKLSELEASGTISYKEAEDHRRRMSSWHAALGQSDTIDMDILTKKVSTIATDIDTMYEEVPDLRPTREPVSYDSSLDTISDPKTPRG